MLRNLSRRVFDQNRFDVWAESTKRSHHILYAMLAALLFVSAAFALGVMGPRLIREGALLWFGAHAEGVVRDSRIVQVGYFKGGAPKYELTLDYRFVAATGQQYAGSTKRGDVRTPPSLTPGDAMGVYYWTSDPTRSVSEYRLRTDVYALAAFLPFITALSGGGPLWYFLSLRTWRRNRTHA